MIIPRKLSQLRAIQGSRVNVSVSPMFFFLFRDGNAIHTINPVPCWLNSKFSSGTVISIRATPSLAFAAPITFRLKSRDTVLRKSADPSLLLHALLDLSEFLCSSFLSTPAYHLVKSLIKLCKLSTNTMSKSTSLNVIFSSDQGWIPSDNVRPQSPFLSYAAHRKCN